MATAADWIGVSQLNDRLDVGAIAAALPPEAASLAGALRDAEVAGLDERRRENSREAGEAQATLSRLAVAVVVGSGIAALASGLLLYGQGGGELVEPETGTLVGWVNRNVVWITAVQIVGLVIATFAGGVLAARDYGKLWTDRRRAAETDRIRVFETVFDRAAAAPGAGSDGFLRQALEFFRRYQLDLQIAFYGKSAKAQTGRDTRMIVVAALLAAVAAATGLIGSLGGADPNSPFPVAAAFLGIAVPILLSSAQSWRTSNRAAEKAESYRAAADALRNQRLQFTAVQAAADAGDVPKVMAFVDAVHGVISTENGAFVGSGPISAPAPRKP